MDDSSPVATTEQESENGHTPKAALKALADELGCPLKDLLVLAPQNDPFNAGSPTDLAQARWFAEIFQKYGFKRGVHVRKIHYKLQALRENVVRPDGKLYENTEESWRYLEMAAKKARYLGLVDPADFDDRRNPDPVDYAPEPREAPEPDWHVDDEFYWHLPEIDSSLSFYIDVPQIRVSGYDYEPGDQPYHEEVWIEKSTENDVLEPICQQYGVTFRPGLGFQSITTATKALARFVELSALGRPSRIFYIADHDPAGDFMPVAVARQLEFWLWKNGLHADVKLILLALTREQVEQYDLPRKPIKESDRRKAGFEERRGEGAVELDALEALHEGALARIVGDALLQYRDEGLEARLEAAAYTAETEADSEWESAIEEIKEEVSELRDEVTAVVKPFKPKLDKLAQELEEALAPVKERIEEFEERAQEAVNDAANLLCVDLPDRPEPDTDPSDESDWLFDSSRSYAEQLKHYRIHKNGGAA